MAGFFEPKISDLLLQLTPLWMPTKVFQGFQGSSNLLIKYSLVEHCLDQMEWTVLVLALKRQIIHSVQTTPLIWGSHAASHFCKKIQY